MSAAGELVTLYVYDLSQGLARQMSPAFLGKTIDAIYHTGIVVFGYEYYYGGGIQAARPGNTAAGSPMQRLELGRTTMSQQAFHDFLRAESHKFTPETYDLLAHNCNNFSSHCAKFLLNGNDIPAHITGLPGEVLATPLGAMLRPLLDGMQSRMRTSFNHAGSAGAGAGGGLGAGLVPWQESGLPSSHASLWLPPIRTGDAATASVAAAAAAQTTGGSGSNSNSGAAGVLTPLPVPPEATEHRELPLRVSGPARAQITAATDARGIAAFGVLLKAALRRPQTDPGRALTEDESAAALELVPLLGKASPAEFPADAVEQATPGLARAAATWDGVSLFPLLNILRVVCLNPAAGDAFARLLYPYALVPRLCKLATGATQAGPEACKTDLTLGPKVVAAALEVLLNISLLPAASRLLASDAGVVTAATRALHHGTPFVRAAAACLLQSLARTTFEPTAAGGAAAAAADTEASAAAAALPRTRGELTDELNEALVSLVATLSAETDAGAAAAQLGAVCELVYLCDAAAMLVNDLELSPEAVYRPFAGNAAAGPSIKALCEDLQAMVALSCRSAE